MEETFENGGNVKLLHKLQFIYKKSDINARCISYLSTVLLLFKCLYLRNRNNYSF